MISSSVTITFCVIDSENAPKMLNTSVSIFSDLNDSTYVRGILKDIFDKYNSKFIIGSGNSFNLKFKPIHKILVDDYVVENPLALFNYIADNVFKTWDKISRVKITNLSSEPNVTYIYYREN